MIFFVKLKEVGFYGMLILVIILYFIFFYIVKWEIKFLKD